MNRILKQLFFHLALLIALMPMVASAACVNYGYLPSWLWEGAELPCLTTEMYQNEVPLGAIVVYKNNGALIFIHPSGKISDYWGYTTDNSTLIQLGDRTSGGLGSLLSGLRDGQARSMQAERYEDTLQ